MNIFLHFIKRMDKATLLYVFDQQASESEMVEKLSAEERAHNPDYQGTDVVKFTNFPPSSVIAFK